MTAPALTLSDAAATLAAARLVVVKVGSALLIGADGAVARDWLATLAADIAAVRATGRQVVVVSSGAVALGRRRLDRPARRGAEAKTLALADKQAAAAVGQSLLMQAWEAALAPHGLTVGQILLTREDTERRRRWLNARATLEALLDAGVIPVINENDTVATEEIRYGDNDRLAARAAQLARAEALVLLSDVDGLYTADPRRDPAARRLDRVEALTPDILAMAGGANAVEGVGSGGMATKLMAAAIARAAGCATVIASGQADRPLDRIALGGPATLIAAPDGPMAAWKSWIAGSVDPTGALVLDAGAADALRAGKSLLPSGVTAVEGRFDRGDSVRIVSTDGARIGVGLAAYASDDMARIRGLRSDAIEGVLGWRGPPVVVHRDDMVIG